MSDDEQLSDRPKWSPFSRAREVSAFILGASMAGFVLITGRTELAVLFALIALGAKADNIHLPRVQKEPVYAVVGFVVAWIVVEVWGLVPL